MIKAPKIKYLVSSHVRYYKKTLPKIIPSLTCQISPKNIVVTIGGKSSGEDVGVETHWVPYNAFEYSSLINVVELDYSDCDYVFLLHDTMICGERFARLSMKADFTRNAIMAHEKAWCNLGAFKVSFLFSAKDLLLSMKDISKEKAISLEGGFFGDYSTYENPSVELLEDYQESPYGGNKRCLCRFNSVDVLKYGSNDSARFRKGIINTDL
jgi:hypothetical protein